MLLGLSCAYDSPGDSVKIQILIQRPWGWSGGGAEILHFSQPPPHSSAGKECTRDAGDPSSIPGLGRSPGEGIGYPRQYSWASLVAQTVESSCNVGDLGSIPGLGRSPGGGNGNPLQYSCLENSMDRGAWQATVHWVEKSWTQLNNFHFYFSSQCVYREVSVCLAQ